jgi:hypothetical protein
LDRGRRLAGQATDEAAWPAEAGINDKESVLNIKSSSADQVLPGQLKRLFFCSACAVALVALGGCGDSERPVVGQFTFFTNASGAVQTAPITVLQHNGTPNSIYLDATVTNDPEALGVDWTVTCSRSLPEGSLPAGQVDTSCGSFTPYHTTSGPMPSYTLPPGVAIVTQYTAPQNWPAAGTVTIVAHATSLPSSTSSVTFTIM